MELNGTYYDSRTPPDLAKVLEDCRQREVRIALSYGDAESGKDWLEECETTGTLSRSMGPQKVPIMLANARSTGGMHILDHCVVRVRTAKGGRVLWQHPNYHHGKIEVKPCKKPIPLPDARVLRWSVLRDGETQASFETQAQALRYCTKLGLVIS